MREKIRFVFSLEFECVGLLIIFWILSFTLLIICAYEECVFILFLRDRTPLPRPTTTCHQTSTCFHLKMINLDALFVLIRDTNIRIRIRICYITFVMKVIMQHFPLPKISCYLLFFVGVIQKPSFIWECWIEYRVIAVLLERATQRRCRYGAYRMLAYIHVNWNCWPPSNIEPVRIALRGQIWVHSNLEENRIMP